MTTAATAVLFATAPGEGGAPAAALRLGERSLCERLCEQLRSLGAADVRLLARRGRLEGLEPPPGARLIVSADLAEDLRHVAAVASEETGPLVLAHAELVAHREALAQLLGDPRAVTGSLCGAGAADGAPAFPVRVAHGAVASAGSPIHAVTAANRSFLGLVRVAETDRPALAATAARLAALLDAPPPAWRERLADATGERGDARAASAAREDALALAHVGLVRAGVRVLAFELRGRAVARPLTAAQVAAARRELDALDEQRLALDAAVKASDGFFTTFLVSPWSRHVARWAARRGLRPNQVTGASLAIGIAAAVAFAAGDRLGLVLGALALQIAFAADCVDGQLARYTRTFTPLGAWLDATFDRAKEYLVYAGLAIGAARAGADVWVLAGAALTLQTARHALDHGFAASERARAGEAPAAPLEQPGDGAPARRAAPARLLDASLASERRPGVVWLKRIAVFPIGERLAAISLTAALWGPRTTFVVLLAAGAAAGVYGLAGRGLRVMSR